MKYLLILFTCISFGQFNPIFFGQGSLSQRLKNKGLIAVYNFQNNAVDKVNSYNGGVGAGLSFTSGVFNNAASFSGSSTSNVIVPDNNAFSFTNGVNDLPFTFKLNFKQTVGGGNPFLITKNDNSAGTNNEYRVDVVAGIIRIMLIDPSGFRIAVSTTSAISLNTFYNLIITYDASKTVAGIKIYLNGVLQTTTPSTVGVYAGMSNTTRSLNFGTSSTNLSSDWFTGVIDELYIYNKVIDATEITYLQSFYY